MSVLIIRKKKMMNNNNDNENHRTRNCQLSIVNCQLPKTVVIDNYDSFTYNLVHLLRELGDTPDVVRNDRFELADLAGYERILLSPGPGIPEEAGRLLDVIRTYAADKAILGICLGHQAIGQVFGAKLKNLAHVYHGVQTPIEIAMQGNATQGSVAQGITPIDPLFKGFVSPMPVGRYHSWVVDTDDFPDCLEVTATDAEGNIMALRHRTHRVCGVQFHPESVLTPNGVELLRNWYHQNDV
jgi:anthranilate synthase component 2